MDGQICTEGERRKERRHGGDKKGKREETWGRKMVEKEVEGKKDKQEKERMKGRVNMTE